MILYFMYGCGRLIFLFKVNSIIAEVESTAGRLELIHGHRTV